MMFIFIFFLFVSFSLEPLQHWTEPNMHTNPPWINNNAKDYLMSVIQANSYDAFEKPTFKYSDGSDGWIPLFYDE